ncbi:S-adenosylmethionine synthase [Bacteroidia bacterium]|nr:S-adenosylmethionine synthase [Bacteroidia bacterium]
MSYLFTSESVSEGHPDKVADQISDALLDTLLAYDCDAKMDCGTFVTTGQVVVAMQAYGNDVDIRGETRRVIQQIGYTKGEYRFEAESCGICTAVQLLARNVNRGVERADALNQGANEQGAVFGYATNETPNYMPLALDLAHQLLIELAEIRKNSSQLMPYLAPDAKAQVTIQYSDSGVPEKIDTVAISIQHDGSMFDREAQEKIKHDVINILLPRVKAKYPQAIQKLFTDTIIYHVTPTAFGGPGYQPGITGRQIIADTYGGKGAHGGGGFSGKNPSHISRSAAYAARHIAKNLVAAGIADEILVQVAYVPGVAKPLHFFINTYGKSHVNLTDTQIAEKVSQIFDMRPEAIKARLKLRNPIYFETASYGHMGRQPETVQKTFSSRSKGDKTLEVELFTWEKLDYVDVIKAAFADHCQNHSLVPRPVRRKQRIRHFKNLPKRKKRVYRKRRNRQKIQKIRLAKCRALTIDEVLLCLDTARRRFEEPDKLLTVKMCR